MDLEQIKKDGTETGRTAADKINLGFNKTDFNEYVIEAHKLETDKHLTQDEKDAITHSPKLLTGSNPVVDVETLDLLGTALTDHKTDDAKHLTVDQNEALNGAINPLTALNPVVDMALLTTGLESVNDNVDNVVSDLELHKTDWEKHLGTDQNAALDGANSPNSSNPLATMNDIPAPAPPPDLTNYPQLDTANTFKANQHFEGSLDVDGNVIVKSNSGLNIIANVDGSADQKIYHLNGNGPTGTDDIATVGKIDELIAAIPAAAPPVPTSMHELIPTVERDVQGLLPTKMICLAGANLIPDFDWSINQVFVIVDTYGSIHPNYLVHYMANGDVDFNGTNYEFYIATMNRAR